MIVLLDEKSGIDKDFREDLNKTLMVEYRSFLKSAQPVIRETKSKVQVKVLSETVSMLEHRCSGYWHSATFMLRHPKAHESILDIGQVKFISFASLNSYTDVTGIYSSFRYENGKVYTDKSVKDDTFRVSMYWREDA